MRSPRGALAVFLGAATIGLAPILVRWAVPASPLVVGFYRMAIALPFAAVYAFVDRSRWDAAGVRWAMLAGACFFGDLALWHTSIHLTSASVATIFVCLAPFWVALFETVVRGMRMSPARWAGLALAVLGAIGLGLARPSDGGAIGLGSGELAGIGASFCYAGYTLCLGRARETASAPKALAPSILVAALLFGASGHVAGDAFTGFPDQAWLALLGLGVVVQTGAWLAISYGLGHVDARVGALTLLVQPVSTVLLGAGLLGERLSAPELAGAALVLTGVGLATGSIASSSETDRPERASDRG